MEAIPKITVGWGKVPQVAIKLLTMYETNTFHTFNGNWIKESRLDVWILTS